MNKKESLILVMACVASLLLPPVVDGQNVQPIALKDAVNTALRSSREVTLAQAKYNAAETTVGVNRSVFQPNLYTGSGAAWTYGFPLTPGGAAPSIINVSYIQSVFNPLQTAQVRASQERKEEQRLELEKTRNTVALQTISAYLELGKVRHSLELLQNERQSNTRVITLTEQRVKEGFELPIEANKAELAASRTELRIVQLQNQESQLQQQLAMSMGLPPLQRIEVSTDSLGLQTTDREADVIDRAVQASLVLRQDEFERRANQHLVAGEIGTKWPTIDLVGEYGLYCTCNNFQKFYTQFQANNLAAGLQIRIPLISSQRSSNIAYARSQLAVSEIQLRNRRQTVEIEASRQYQKLREAEATREVARLDLKVAQENLKEIQANFQQDRASLRDVERARSEENEKWLAFLDSDYDRQKAQLELLSTTGDLSKVYQ
jgi:outer membrane protein TolC